MKWAYLLINLLSVAVPLAFSFETKVNFMGRWKAIFSAIAVTALPFLVWDSLFTQWGVWGFSGRYTLGTTIFGLPPEEVMFFVAIPYCCLFTYEVLNRFAPWQPDQKTSNTILGLFAVLLAVLGTINHSKAYTSWAFLLAAIFLLVHLVWAKWPWMPKYLRAYVVTLVPFLVVNGLLTGSGLDEPIVWYNNRENLGVRMLTIPIEDTVYGFLLLGLNTAAYEYFKAKFQQSAGHIA